MTRATTRIAAAVALALGFASAPVAAQDDEAGFLERLIQTALGGSGREVTVRGLSGTLSSEATIERIEIADADGVWLSIQDVALDWQRTALLRRRLQVEALTIGRIEVARPPLPAPDAAPEPEPEPEEADADGPFALPSLPVAVNVDELTVGALVLGEPLVGQAAEFTLTGNASLQDGEGAARLALVRVDGRDGSVRLSGSFDNETRVLAIDLGVEEAADGLVVGLANIPGAPSLRLDIEGEDPIDAFNADIALRTDGTDRLVGDVAVTALRDGAASAAAGGAPERRITADLDGDLAELFLPDYRAFFGRDQRLGLTVEQGANFGVAVERLDLAAQGVELSGTAALSADFLPERIDVQGRLGTGLGLPVVLPLPGPQVLVASGTIDLDYDAAAGDDFMAAIDVAGVQTADGLLLDRAELVADGTIERSAPAEIARVGADIDGVISGFATTDPAIWQAVQDGGQLTARVDWAAGGLLRLTGLDLTAGDLGLAGDVTVAGLETGAIEVETVLSAEAGDLDRFSGLAGQSLGGALAAEVDARYATESGNFNVTLDGTAEDLSVGEATADDLFAGVMDIGVTAARTADGIALDRLALAGPRLEITGNGAVGPDNLPRAFALTGRIGDPDGDPVDLPVPGAETEIQSVDLSVDYDPEADGALTALADVRGLVREGLGRLGRVTLDADGSLQPGDGAIAAAALDLQAAMADLSLVDPDLDAALAPGLTVDASADYTADGGQLELARLDLRSGEVALTGSGTAAGVDGSGLTAAGELRLDAAALDRFAPLLARYVLDQDLASLLAPGLQARVVGRYAETSGTAEVDTLSLRSGELALEAMGQAEGLGSQAVSGKGELALDAPDLSRFAPLLASFLPDRDLTAVLAPGLQLDVAGRYSGGDGSAALENLALSSGELSLRGEGTAEGLGTESAAADLDLTLDSGPLARFAALAGQPIRGRITADATAQAAPDRGDFAVDLEARGNSLAAGIDQVDQILAGQSLIDVQLRRADGVLTIEEAVLDTAELDLTASGSTGADGAAISLQGGLRDVGIFTPDFAGPLRVDGQIRNSGEVWSVDADLAGPAGSEASVAGDVVRPDGTLGVNLTGAVPLGLANRILAPRSVNGTATFDLGLDGPPELDSVTGTLSIADARLADPTLRLALEDIDTTVSLAGGTATLDAQSRLSSGGRILAEGPVGLSGDFPADLTIRLRDLLLVDPRLYEVGLGGRIDIDGGLASDADITGQINIGPSEIRVPAGLGGAAGVIDVRHLREPDGSFRSRQRAGIVAPGDPGSEPQTGGGGGPVYGLDVAIVAPNQIFVRGRGLDVELGGRIDIGGTTARPEPRGRFELIRGRLALLGRNLQFQTAAISLQGDLEPDIEMVATSRTSEIDASIAITGPALDPEIEFRSNPELPQDEVLAQLFFGKPVQDLTPLELAQLAAAINRLTGGGGRGPLGFARETLGVDQLGVERTQDGTTAVTAGRYITERLYSDVTVDSEGESQVELNYEIQQDFSVRGRFNNEGETGVGFVFERDY